MRVDYVMPAVFSWQEGIGGRSKVLFAVLDAGGQWHHSVDGVPFSSQAFVQICHNLWHQDECCLTSQQLVWTSLVVRILLQSNSRIDKLGR